MTQIAANSGITFAVDAVTPATERLPECRTHEAVKARVAGEIESCSDYHSMVVRDVGYQPLLAAVYLAFSRHRPLVLTPDAVWITIAQGVAHHMALHAERLRSRFVSHQGKLDLVFEVRDWVEGSPENPWPDAFAAWAGQIRDHVGPAIHGVLACDFSTSGPVERAVGDIVMMDASFQGSRSSRWIGARSLRTCAARRARVAGSGTASPGCPRDLARDQPGHQHLPDHSG